MLKSNCEREGSQEEDGEICKRVGFHWPWSRNVVDKVDYWRLELTEIAEVS